ncbi:MAG: TRAM domain-containing protein [Candidatus Anstonellales archaeon]
MDENKKSSSLLPKPVNEGDELDVTIVSKGKKDGDGIAKTKEGFVIIVEGANEVGKKYHVKITRVGLTVAWAQVTN